MIKNTITLLALTLITTAWGQDKAKFLSSPSLSPDGQTAYFTYNGDIWQVPTQGGEALRLTALEGEATNPRVSPDGQWIAFTSTQYGNKDVFVMPLTGGKIIQLTYHQANEEMESWSWDSKKIYFTTNAYNNFASFEISRDGGTPTPLFTNYFNYTNGLVTTPNGEYLFTSSMESANQTARKRYKGENNPDILGYNPKTNTFKSHTTYNGKDFNPTVDREGNIYFISDENNGNYNLYTIKDGVKTALTSFDTSIKTPYAAADGSKVIFEKDYELYLYNTASNTSEKLAVNIHTNTAIEKQQAYDIDKNISAFDVAFDDKKIAFVSRGILFVSDIEGKFIQQITDGKERVMEVKWLKDNQTVLFSQTYQGYQNWYKVKTNGTEKPQQITKDHRNNRDLVLNEEGNKAVYISGRDEVRLLDLKTFVSTTLVKDEIWAFQNSAPSFSPDDQYVLFTAKRNFEDDIFIHHIEKRETINLTNTGVAESNPIWSPNGKHIYFTSDRFNPSYPLGAQNPKIYRLALDWYSEPFRSDEYTKLFKEEKTAETDLKKRKKNKQKATDKENKEKSTQKTINVNTVDILDRIELVSDRFGNQRAPIVFKDDNKEYVYYLSNQENGKSALYRKIYEPFEEEKTEKVNDLQVWDIVKKEKNLYALSKGDIYKFSLSKSNAEKIVFKYSFTKNLTDEFNQMYYETWAGVEENFYDENFHGIDWFKTKEDFAKQLPYVTQRGDLRVLLNDMLGELGSSHLGFSTRGNDEKTDYKAITYETGLVFNTNNPYQVDRIVRKSPVFARKTNIQVGDELIKVNGIKVEASKNRDQYFTFPNKQEELALTFNRAGKEHTVKLHPISYNSFKGLLYDEWIYNNKQRVDQLSDNRIVYTYMKNMTTSELDTFLLDMVAQENQKEGVILDLRYNTGGNVHDKVLNFLSQRPYLKWKYREGKYAIQSNFTPSGKPIVLLINEASLSDAEMTAAGFKALKLGTIIGQETYRWIIFTSGKSLVDGSNYRLPAWGTYTLDNQNLEKTGVAPDIYVKNTFLDRLNDKDPQLERAIQEILKDLK
ncbi:S41 family peptidase [Myroides pelagicus]|uniref:S41 family peptidase n=1 Tax=Myroides pelagicus TaxID=270914 RepID=UPI002DB9C391|nr:S41 family peptidase [Myroides pelagicus]MEC4112915.1 S41 family peptidase [Myroides pelagicus]